MRILGTLAIIMTLAASAAEWPGPIDNGYALPNGWRITPVGESVPTEDLPTQLIASPDGAVIVGVHSGFNNHGLIVINAKSGEVVQRIPVPTTWFGLAWSPDGARLYVSGGNNKKVDLDPAPIYVHDYRDGRLSESPVAKLTIDLAHADIFWSGLAHHPSSNHLYAVNRHTNRINVFDTTTSEIVRELTTETDPYDVVVSSDGRTLYCSNWGSDTVSVFDTESATLTRTIAVGDNPNDMLLAADGRLYVCCSNDNTVHVIDTAQNRSVESIVTSMYPRAPEGSTPNALAISPDQKTLYVANADNNNIAVVNIEEMGESDVLGFVPAGWYPCALATNSDGSQLFIGNAKGSGSYSNLRGPHSPITDGEEGKGSVKSLMKGSVQYVNVAESKDRLREWTQQVYANCPYNDELLANAKPSSAPSVVPREVGAASPIKHVIYIIKENRTYDQVLGDLPQGNGDARITLFGREVTPNIHALAEQFVLLDNLYCDAEVSRDGHQWSNAAYATDFVEKNWPASYGGKSDHGRSPASIPSAGYIWDQCARKGLTYRTYGEFANRVSESEPMAPADPRLSALQGHVCPDYLSWDARDTDNAAVFIREFDEYEKNYGSPDAEKRLPNFVVMALPEDHTKGTRPGVPTPRAAVASNDLALGTIVERISHSRYWPELAVFVIEDDAQDGSDHVDARRTVGLAISAYTPRATVDSTFYTTSSMLRTIELLLGLQPMSQFDAAANPMYASFGTTLDPTPYAKLDATIDINELNTQTTYGAKESLNMDFSDYDRTPMFALNEILWKSIRGADSEMPLPQHRFHAAALAK